MRSTQNLKYTVAAFVSSLTFLDYLTSLRNTFVNWDDYFYVYENPSIRSLNLSFFKWAFLDFHVGNWHPLTWLSHALDYAVWGLNPLGHHLTNNVLHAANTFLVVLLMIKLLEIRRQSKIRDGLSIFPDDRAILIAGGVAGLLFGIHPVHVESVAWISERKDLLCGLFFLLSTMMYVKYAGGQEPEVRSQKSEGNRKDGSGQKSLLSNNHYLAALGLFVLALMSKPMAVSLPVVLLILDWHPFNRIRSLTSFFAAVTEKIPFIAFCIISSFLTVLAQKKGMVLMDFVPLSSRLIVANGSIIAYLWKMLMPLNLIPFYPYPREISFASFEYILPILIVAVITVFCVVTAKKQKLWLSIWGYYVVTLIPVLGIVQVGLQSMADRYTYLPSLGPFFLIGLACAWLYAKRPLAVKIALITCAVLTFSSLFYLTVQQIGIWKNSVNLWSYVIDKEPGKVPIAYYDRGMAYEDNGQDNNALEDYTMAIALDQFYLDAYIHRGGVFEKMGQVRKAIEDYDKVIATAPSYPEAHLSRGIAFDKMGQVDKAIEDYEREIELDPNNVRAYTNRGILYARTRSFSKALTDLSKAITLNPREAKYYANRGRCYFNMGQYEMALADYNKAIELDRNFDVTYYDRGELYLSTNRKDLAVSDLRKACDLGNEQACNMSKSVSGQGDHVQ